MLQGILKVSRYSWLGCLGLVLNLAACKPDSIGPLEEKAAYLADYENPAHHWGFIDTTGQLVIPAVYDEVSPFSEGKAAVNKIGLWGYIDISGKILIKPQFRSAYNFHENRARVKSFEHPDGYITPSGKAIFSDDWTAVDDFSNSRALVKSGSLYGFIDTSGHWAAKPVFDRAWNFHGGLAVVEVKSKQGLIDLNGKYIIAPEFDHLTHASEFDLIFGTKDSTALLMDQDGNEKVKLKEGIIRETDGHLMSVQKQNRMWLYDIEGKKFLSDTGYHQLFYLGKQRWCAKMDTAYFLLNEEGKVISNGYTQLNKFFDHAAVFHQGKFWGYLDVNGDELTKSIFGQAWDYRDGFARVAFKDGLNYINKNQEIAFYPPPGTVDMRDFNEGFAPVQMQ